MHKIKRKLLFYIAVKYGSYGKVYFFILKYFPYIYFLFFKKNLFSDDLEKQQHQTHLWRYLPKTSMLLSIQGCDQFI